MTKFKNLDESTIQVSNVSIELMYLNLYPKSTTEVQSSIKRHQPIWESEWASMKQIWTKIISTWDGVRLFLSWLELTKITVLRIFKLQGYSHGFIRKASMMMRVFSYLRGIQPYTNLKKLKESIHFRQEANRLVLMELNNR